jgi:hypothetical protein
VVVLYNLAKKAGDVSPVPLESHDPSMLRATIKAFIGYGVPVRTAL